MAKLHPEAKKLWAEVRNKNCKLCPLHEEANTVCLLGNGPVESAKFMVIGEAPGFREDDVAKPFAGRSGQLLDSMLDAAGLSRDDAYITNINKCRPPINRTPKKAEAKACRPYLDAELDAVKPEFILLLGNHALSLINKGGILKHRGEVFDFHGAKVLPTIHPAAALRNPKNEPLIKTDIFNFHRLMKGETKRENIRIKLVQDRRGLKVLLKMILRSEAIAYDVETSGRVEDKDGKIATISISPMEGVAFVVPIHHPESKWKKPRAILRLIAKAMMVSGAKLIAHNAKFDDLWIRKYGATGFVADFDTMIAAHVIDENQLKGLKPLAQVILGAPPWKIDTSDCMSTPLKTLARYNALDTEYTLRLYYYFREELKKERRVARLFQLLMMPASRSMTRVQETGMWLDQEKLQVRLVEVQKKVDKLQRRIDKRASKIRGEETHVNPRSPQQLAKLLFGDLKLPVIELTKGGADSTKESVLLRLRFHHPIIEDILEHRSWSKDLGFLEGWIYKLAHDGRIHPNYKIVGTVTGRMSSGKEEGSKEKKGLNVQQTPRKKEIRSIIGAPPGWKFVEADFSQIELRLAAEYSQDPVMLQIFRDGRDPHMEMAVSLTGKPVDKIESEERKKAKGVNFGYLYGMWWRKFIEYARDNYGLQVSEKEAAESRETFFATYRMLEPWHKRQRRLVNNYKQVQSLIGRVRHLPDVDSEDKGVRQEAERQAINSPVQSLASDLMLLSLVLLDEILPPDEAKIVGSIHDALLFEIREDCVEKWVPIIKYTMENLPLKKKFGVELGVPIEAEVKVGTHWGEGEVWAA